MSEVLARVRIMNIMNDAGHTSFGWDEADDEWVLPMIRQKMAQGYVFWIVRRNPLREVQLERVDDVRDVRHVIIRDQAARTLFEQGRIGIVADDDDDHVETVRRARTAEEVASNDTVAHRRLGGG